MTNSYPYLPTGKTIKYVSIENPYMAQAKVVRDTESSDLNHSTGAVVVLDNKIIGYGANKSALTNKRLLNFHKKGWCIRRILKIPSGQKYWLCPGCSSPDGHAESRAVKNALNNQSSIKDADLYLYGHWWCCKPCWDKMIAAGISNVFLLENSKDLFK